MGDRGGEGGGVTVGGEGGRGGRVVVRLSLANMCHNIAAPFKALLSLVDLIDVLTMFISYLFLSRLYSHFLLPHGGQLSASQYRRIECLR